MATTSKNKSKKSSSKYSGLSGSAKKEKFFSQSSGKGGLSKSDRISGTRIERTQDAIGNPIYSQPKDFSVESGNAVIPVEQIKGNLPTVPTVPVDTTNYAAVNAGLTAQPISTLDQSLENQKSNFETMLENLVEPPSQADIYAKAQRESGILKRQEEVGRLSEQLNTIQAQGQASQLQVVGQGRGIPEAIIGGQQAQIARETAIASLPVAAQLQAAQGNLEMAQQNLNQLFQIRSADATAKYEYKNNLVKSVYDFANKQEQAKLDEALRLENRSYEEKQKNLSIAQNYAQMAFQNGQSSLGAQISSLDHNSPTFSQDLARLQIKLKDPSLALDMQIKGLQIKKLQDELTGATTDIIPKTLPNGKLDVVDEVTQVINASGKDVPGSAGVIGVLAALQKLALANTEGQFKGAAPLKIAGSLRGEESRGERIATRGDIGAIELKTQQWASGASLTKDQERKVKRLTPDKNDSDFKIREKINGLTDFMQQQVRSELAAKGVSYEPTPVDYFAATTTIGTDDYLDNITDILSSTSSLYQQAGY